MRIVCGKHDNINLTHEMKGQHQYKLKRIRSENPNKTPSTSWSPLSTNGKTIFYQNKKLSFPEFIDIYEKSKPRNLIVLTLVEKELLIEGFSHIEGYISVFELVFPIYNNIFYSSQPIQNHFKLLSLLKKNEKIGIKESTLGKWLTKKHLYTIERVLRFKNDLDKFFYFALKGGYQEVFKLIEERDDRLIISLDFNSMYAKCLEGIFPDPKRLRRLDTLPKPNNDETLYPGLYLVVLKGPKDTFFRNYHPFKYARLDKSLHFNLEDNQEIEIFLYDNEIHYYKKFFKEVEILDGIVSLTGIEHPLHKKSLKIYKNRLKYRNNGDHTNEQIAKMSLAMMHSCTNQKVMKYSKFSSLSNLSRFLRKQFMINISDKNNRSEIEFLTKSNKLNITYTGTDYLLRYPHITSAKNLYCLSSKVISNARLLMTQTIEKLLLFEKLDICYTNIDSIHVSIPASKIDDFQDTFANLIHAQCGGLKIQAIAEKGYWFDVGRYWLKNKIQTVAYKNIKFNRKHYHNPYTARRKYYIKSTTPEFSYIRKAYCQLDNEFSYTKRLNKYCDNSNVKYERFNFEKIANPDTATNTYLDEIISSKKYKVDLFKKISSS